MIHAVWRQSRFTVYVQPFHVVMLPSSRFSSLSYSYLEYTGAYILLHTIRSFISSLLIP